MLCGFVVGRLQCLQFSERTRFPFHDSQVLCWSLKSLQERPKRRRRGPRSAKRPPRDAKTAPRGAKRAPRGAKTRPRAILGAIWGRFWTRRGRPNLDFHCNCRRKSRFSIFPKPTDKETQIAPNGGVRETKMAPRSAPGAARSGPRGAKRAPGAAKSDPGELQEPP